MRLAGCWFLGNTIVFPLFPVGRGLRTKTTSILCITTHEGSHYTLPHHTSRILALPSTEPLTSKQPHLDSEGRFRGPQTTSCKLFHPFIGPQSLILLLVGLPELYLLFMPNFTCKLPTLCWLYLLCITYNNDASSDLTNRYWR
jgi:hypothetical protein